MATLDEQKATADQSLEQHIAHIIDQEIFHPPNLLEDEQLRQNIDNNGFMPLAFITGNPLINSLTSDVDRIKRAVSLCHAIQLMEDGRTIKVDLNPKRTTLILRDQPNNATQKDIEQIFSDPNCAKFREMRPDISNTWFVTFDSEEDCMKTVMYLQHERKMSVGVKTSVHPLAERMESPVAQRQRPIASPTATTSAVTAPPDIIATATISPSSGPSPPDYYDAMHPYRNPYALLSTSGPPLGPVYARDPAMQAPLRQSPPPPIVQSPHHEPVVYQRPVEVQPTTEPAVGDYQKKFRHYNLQQLVDVYQGMYKRDELVKPPGMTDPEFLTERQESTMVQQPRNPRPKPRAEKTTRRRSPRGRNRGKRGGPAPQQRPPQQFGYPEEMYPPSYYYPQPQPEQFYDQGGFYDTFGQPNYGYRDDFDDGYDEPPERRPQRRRSPRGQKQGGRGRGGKGRGGRSGRQQRPRKEYRPVGSQDEYPQPDAAQESINGSPKRQNKGKSNPRSPANSRRGSKRGKRKLVYRAKESS